LRLIAIRSGGDGNLIQNGIDASAKAVGPYGFGPAFEILMTPSADNAEVRRPFRGGIVDPVQGFPVQPGQKVVEFHALPNHLLEHARSGDRQFERSIVRVDVRTMPLGLFLTIKTVFSPRYGVQSFRVDGIVAFQAYTVAAVVDSHKSAANTSQEFRFAVEITDR
jgi:hypothetical protein